MQKARGVTEDVLVRAMELQQQALSLQKTADALHYAEFTTSRGSIWTKYALSGRLKSA